MQKKKIHLFHNFLPTAAAKKAEELKAKKAAAAEGELLSWTVHDVGKILTKTLHVNSSCCQACRRAGCQEGRCRRRYVTISDFKPTIKERSSLTPIFYLQPRLRLMHPRRAMQTKRLPPPKVRLVMKQ